MFVLRKSETKNTIKFSWTTNKKMFNNKVVNNIQTTVNPFCIDNIRKYITSLLNIALTTDKYICCVNSKEFGGVISGNEYDIINSFKYIYFFEVRHNTYVNKQFNLINNAAKICVIFFKLKRKKSPFLLKLPCNVEILSDILLNIVKTVAFQYAGLKRTTNYRISIMLKENGHRTKLKYDKYICIPLNNDIRVEIYVINRK